MNAAPGQRDALIAILLEGVADMPGCLSYIVAQDTTDANAIWITEAWESKTSHEASLSLPAVKEAIAKARPLIVGFGRRVVTMPGRSNTLSDTRSSAVYAPRLCRRRSHARAIGRVGCVELGLIRVLLTSAE